MRIFADKTFDAVNMFTSHKHNEDLPQWYRVFSSVLTFVAAAAVCLCIVLAIVADAGRDGRSIFGHTVLRVAGDSMSPFLVRGDVISCKDYDGGQLKEGDVIVFVAPDGNFKGAFITHRIHEIISDGGDTQILTKGDAANTPDSWTLSPDDVVGVYEKKLPFIASVTEFTSSTEGKAILIAVPMALFFVVIYLDAALAVYLRKRAANGASASGSAEVDKDRKDDGTL